MVVTTEVTFKAFTELAKKTLVEQSHSSMIMMNHLFYLETTKEPIQAKYCSMDYWDA